MDFNSAVAQLCSEDWETAPSYTRAHEDVLTALLPASRTQDGRLALGASPGAIEAIVRLLRDPFVFLEPVGLLAVRLLRNLCACSVPNQQRAAAVGAHALVMEAIRRRIDASDRLDEDGRPARVPAALRRIEGDGSPVSAGRLRLPFFSAAVEFLCNFATCNVANADLIWDAAFPDLFFQILECDNGAVCAAGTALLHNCIAATPERAEEVLRRWAEEEGRGGRTLAESLVQRLHCKLNGQEGEDLGVDEATFWWTCQVIRRLVGAGLLENVFASIGVDLDGMSGKKQVLFSPHQMTLIVVLEAAISESAEALGGEGSAADFTVPDSSLLFFGDLLKISWAKRDGSMFQLAASIIGSLFLVTPEADSIDELKQTATAEAVNALIAIHLEAHRAAEQEVSAPSFPVSDPVTGLRGAAVRLIALAADRDRKIQNLVRDMSGLVPVLSALSYEKDPAFNPFLREWAVIAVRNLCYGNEENAREISKLELIDVRGNEALLEGAGLEAFVGDDGKPKLRVKQ